MNKPINKKIKNTGIKEVSLENALGERYLAYALSTITSRSLPDARDGLKPVHRRLLYAMRQLRLDSKSTYKKSAKVVGNVIGQFHPHGEQAVYDALVRLAQEFSSRYPLVSGQGNFGSVDGDSAAAMRYTEARLTYIAESLLNEIDEDTVDFRPTYDGEEDEPLVLPAAFPNLLANGANGIAVGMATSIPPHNLGELCDALLHVIKFPRATVTKLVDLVPGPDFPTGGVLVESAENIVSAYRSGKGSFRLRAKWNLEKQGRGTWCAIVTEIPYQIQKSRLIERIAELIVSKKAPLLADVRDESAEDIRLVLEPRNRSIDPEILMEALFQSTDLEIRVPLNLNVLDAGRLPQVLDLREALQAFLNHREQVVLRRTRFRLSRADERIEILDGYLKVFGNLDEIIHIIRSKDKPLPVLKRKFRLSARQAEAILDLRLRRLRKLEELRIIEERDKLLNLRKKLRVVKRDKTERWKIVAEEIKKIREEFGAKTIIGSRRTVISGPPDEVEIPTDIMIQEEPITIVCSDKGWIRALKGHSNNKDDVRYKEGDKKRFWFHAKNTDRITIFSTNGRFYTLPAEKIPKGRGMGESIRLMADLSNGSEIVSIGVHRPEGKLLVASSDGRGLIVEESQIVAQTRQGRQVLNLNGDNQAVVCTSVEGDTVAVIGENRKLLLFPVSELPIMTRGRGMILQRYRDGGLLDAKVFNLSDGLSWQSGSRLRTERELRDWSGKRAQAGRLPPRGFPKNGKFGEI